MPETLLLAQRINPIFAQSVHPPTGTIVPFGGVFTPEILANGYMVCDGSAISRTTYASLFALIGTTYGNGDGLNTFNIPDCGGRAMFGKAASGTFQTLGGTGGVTSHSHTVDSHTHTVASHSHSTTSHTHITPSDIGHVHTEIAGAAFLASTASGAYVVFETNTDFHFHTASTISGGGTDSQTVTLQNAAPSTDSQTILNPYIVMNYLIVVT